MTSQQLIEFEAKIDEAIEEVHEFRGVRGTMVDMWRAGGKGGSIGDMWRAGGKQPLDRSGKLKKKTQEQIKLKRQQQQMNDHQDYSEVGDTIDFNWKRNAAMLGGAAIGTGVGMAGTLGASVLGGDIANRMQDRRAARKQEELKKQQQQKAMAPAKAFMEGDIEKGMELMELSAQEEETINFNDPKWLQKQNQHVEKYQKRYGDSEGEAKSRYDDRRAIKSAAIGTVVGGPVGAAIGYGMARNKQNKEAKKMQEMQKQKPQFESIEDMIEFLDTTLEENHEFMRSGSYSVNEDANKRSERRKGDLTDAYTSLNPRNHEAAIRDSVNTSRQRNHDSKSKYQADQIKRKEEKYENKLKKKEYKAKLKVSKKRIKEGHKSRMKEIKG